VFDLRHRLGVLAILAACLFSGLFVRLGYLQLVEGKKLEVEASKNLLRTVIVPATRGRIVDRNGEVLVDNRLVSVVTIDRQLFPRRIAARAELFERLGSVLTVAPADIARRFNSTNTVLAVEVARDVKESAVVYLGEHDDEFPGVQAKLDFQRVYPKGKLAAHVLGYVGDVGDDLKDPPCNARYRTGDKVGKSGVERGFECVLRGMPGITEFTVDRRDRVLETRVLSPPVAGVDIRLTIDPKVQAWAESSLRQGLAASQGQVGYVFTKEKKLGFQPLKAPAGSVVVEDSSDGSILAMASYPDYDPRDFIRGISTKEFEARYGELAESPLTNRAISGRYPPGSTFKLFTAVSALTDGLIQDFTTIDDPGQFLIPDCDSSKVGLKCLWRNSGETPHGAVDVRKSLIVSSDVFYYMLGYRFWNEAGAPREGIQEVAREFGLNEDTAVQLPYEKSGNIPDRAQRLSRHATNSIVWPATDWRTGDNLNLAIGQGETLTTPLGIANAYGAFGNGGSLFVPKIAFDTPVPLKPTFTLVPTSTSRPPARPSTTTTVTPRVAAGPPAPSSTLGSDGPGTARVAAAVPNLLGQSDVTSTTPQVPTGTDVVPATSTTVASQRPIPPAQYSPILRRRIALPDNVRLPVLDGLTGAVQSSTGTASDAFAGFPFDRFPIAGKTGTAQVVNKQDNALFVGFGGQNGRYVIAVVMEQAGFGGQAAAPVARRVFNGLAGEPLGTVTYVKAPTAQDR